MKVAPGKACSPQGQNSDEETGRQTAHPVQQAARATDPALGASSV